MGSVDISKLDLKVLSKGKIRWANGIWQNARGIHESCPNREDKLRYIEECEKYIRSPENCKIEWNCETHKFGGNKYSYIFYFYSERIN